MTAALAPGLSRKVKKILETKVDSTELLSSLSTLSEVHTSNTAASRRRLRSTLDHRGLEIAKGFLEDAGGVVMALEAIGSELDGLAAACDGISKGLISSKEATAGLLEETTLLKRKLAESQRRSELVTEFLQSYQLSESEVEILTEGEVCDEFFAALERVREIHANCRSLLHGSHQRAGLEIMDAMGGHQEAAYERLCRWVQHECRALGGEDAPEVDDSLQRASLALQQRPVLFKYCAEEVATSRHNALFQRFIAALTRGGPGGMPRPIEMHAHDPRRYVGDMLAWVHQSLASEHELLVSLFGNNKEQSAEDMVHHSTDMPSTATLLDRVFESICRPLKVRIEQVLMSSPPLLLCFKLSHLLAFYNTIIMNLLDEDAHLVQTLKGCKEMASRIFFDQLKAKGDQLQRYPPPPPKDLSAPSQVSDVVRQVLEIIETLESGMEQQNADVANEELGKVLSAGLEPLLAMCEKSGEALSASAPTRVDEGKHLSPSAQRIYLVNCLHTIQTLLGRRPIMDAWTARLNDLMEGHTAALVGSEVGILLGRVGMSEVLDRMRIYQEGEAGGKQMATEPALTLEKVSEVLKKLFSMITEMDALPDLNNLQAPRIRAEAGARISKALAGAYQHACSALADPINGYAVDGNISAHVKHTPAQVATVLGITE